MNITRFLVTLLAPAAKAFEESSKDPASIQEKVLLSDIKRNKDTEYGRRYDFAAIRSTADYQSKVPVTDFETFRPLIERMKQKENGITTKDTVNRISQLLTMDTIVR